MTVRRRQRNIMSAPETQLHVQPFSAQMVGRSADAAKSSLKFAPRARLHGKQAVSTATVHDVARWRRQTELQEAVRAGRVPKAWRAFALFTQHTCTGIRAGRDHIKTVADRW